MSLLQNQQPPSPATLLTLPLELRTLIYHNLLQSLSAPHITFTNKPSNHSPSSNSDTNPPTYRLHGTNIPTPLLLIHPQLIQDLTTLILHQHRHHNAYPFLSTTLNLPSATHLSLSLAPSLLPQLTRLPPIWLSTITTLNLDQVWLATLSLPSLRSTLPALSRIEVHLPTAYATLEGAEAWLKCAERRDVEGCGRALEEKSQLAAGRVFSVRWVRGVVVGGACDGIGLDGLEVEDELGEGLEDLNGWQVWARQPVQVLKGREVFWEVELIYDCAKLTLAGVSRPEKPPPGKYGALE